MPVNKFVKSFLLLCGLVLTLTASAVFAQETQINKKPLQDLANAVSEQIESKTLDLSAPFSIELEGNLNEAGKLDARTSKFVKSEGNEEIVAAAKSAVEAVSDSRILSYLTRLDIKQIHLTVSQDKDQFSVLLVSATLSESRAKTIANALNLLTYMGKNQIDRSIEENITEEIKENRENTLLLLNNSKVSAIGKQISISMQIPAAEFQQLISRQLAKATNK